MLRFNFTEKWKTKSLNDICKIQRGASPRPINSKKWYDNEKKEVGWVRIGDVTESSKFLYKTKDYFSEEGIKKSRFLPKNSLIMSICATIGKPIITSIDTCIHDGFVGFSNLKDVDKEFLYYSLNILEPKFNSLSQKGSQSNLNSDLVGITTINLPSINEQRKIVSFLSLIDKKINILKRKHELYQDFLKYFSQQLFMEKLQFSKEVKCTEKLKFTTSQTEWKSKRLMDVISASSSNLAIGDLEDNFGEYKLYGAIGFIKKIDFHEKSEPYIAIVKDGAGVGRTLLCESNSSILGTLQYLTPKEGNNLQFIYYLLSQFNFRKYVIGSTIPHIYYKDYSKHNICFSINLFTFIFLEIILVYIEILVKR